MRSSKNSDVDFFFFLLILYLYDNCWSRYRFFLIQGHPKRYYVTDDEIRLLIVGDFAPNFLRLFLREFPRTCASKGSNSVNSHSPNVVIPPSPTHYPSLRRRTSFETNYFFLPPPTATDDGSARFGRFEKTWALSINPWMLGIIPSAETPPL